jgi:thiamine biosynthesis lipoprotein
VRRREFLGAVAAGLAAPALQLPPLRLHGERLVERWSWAMGQAVHIQLFAQSEAAGYEAAQAALAELRRVEQRLSLFDDTSELCELNRRAGRASLTADSDLSAVLQAALRFQSASGGAFNPAIEPLMRAWGFHRPRASEPSSAEIADARAAAQAARIEIDGPTLTLPSRETQLDLGGIGVGYGLDRMASVLRRMGIERAFLDVSGDCLALGAPPGETGWRVGIADPRRSGHIIASTRLRDLALATSSNAVSVVHYGRAVRGHVIDPETGWPADAMTQVSVVAGSGIEADALSTAMLVSGRPCEGVMRWYKGEGGLL